MSGIKYPCVKDGTVKPSREGSKPYDVELMGGKPSYEGDKPYDIKRKADTWRKIANPEMLQAIEEYEAARLVEIHNYDEVPEALAMERGKANSLVVIPNERLTDNGCIKNVLCMLDIGYRAIVKLEQEKLAEYRTLMERK